MCACARVCVDPISALGGGCGQSDRETEKKCLLSFFFFSGVTVIVIALCVVDVDDDFFKRVIGIKNGEPHRKCCQIRESRKMQFGLIRVKIRVHTVDGIENTKLKDRLISHVDINWSYVGLLLRNKQRYFCSKPV